MNKTLTPSAHKKMSHFAILGCPQFKVSFAFLSFEVGGSHHSTKSLQSNSIIKQIYKSGVHIPGLFPHSLHSHTIS